MIIPSQSLDRVAPLLFAFLWSTGWIAAKYSSFYAEPLSFLSVRFALAAILFFVICLIAKVPIPTDRATVLRSVFSGALMHGLYLAPLWWAIAHGVPASLSAIIAATQPLLTALAAPMMVNERLSTVQLLGILIGFCGVALAVFPKLGGQNIETVPFFALFINCIGMISVTAGTLFQKRYVISGDYRAMAAWQFVGAVLVTAPLAFALESMTLTLSFGLVAVMSWSIFGNSVISILLLLYLLRHGQASRAASLIYLVPPFAAIQALALFGEWPTLYMIIGMVIAAVGVYLVNRRPTAVGKIN